LYIVFLLHLYYPNEVVFTLYDKCDSA